MSRIKWDGEIYTEDFLEIAPGAEGLPNSEELDGAIREYFEKLKKESGSDLLKLLETVPRVKGLFLRHCGGDPL